MKLEDLYKIAQDVNKTIDEKIGFEVILYLNQSKHENLQQEVFKYNNKTLIGYKPSKNYDVIIGNIKFSVKLKKYT
jgi:hypothetical protein